MLKNNLKYDFKSFGPKVILGIVATAIAAAVGVFLIYFSAILTVDFLPVATVMGLLATVMVVFALVGPIIIVVVSLSIRYNQSMSGEESYLTFTLPVKISTHLFSKAVSALIYSAIAAVVTLINTFIVLLVAGIVTNSGAFYFFGIIINLDLVLQFLVFFPLIFTLSTAASLFVVYTAISISTQFSKYKTAAKIFGWYIVGQVLQIVHMVIFNLYKLATGGINASSFLVGNYPSNVVTEVSFIMLESCFLSFLLSFILFYFLSKYSYSTKINIQ